MPTELSGSIPSLQAQHKKHLLFFVELLVQLQGWHCRKAARAEANLSILGILPRIRSGGSNGVKAALWRCQLKKIWEERQYQLQ
jgi:hypothetical protein